MGVGSNRLSLEKEIARKISSLKQSQRNHRKKYLDLDVKISVLKAMMNELFESRKSYPNQRKRKGDGYAG